MKKRLLVMAGGTGGHVFPALAVAQTLLDQGWEVRWLGTADRMEARLVPQYGLAIEFITISGLRNKGLKAWCMAPIRILRAIAQARAIIRRYQPHVVLGMGGYVSGPGGVAAWLTGVPLVVHEQNGIAGLTNRCLAKLATRVLQAFPGALPGADVVGNPLRKDILALSEEHVPLDKRQGALRLLVLGGSQGAQVLNKTLPQAAIDWNGKIDVWHQTGKGHVEQVMDEYQQVGYTPYRVEAFVDDIAQAYAWADIVVCRSGALTVSEIAAVGIAAIFIPFRHKDRQQYWNALPLEQQGAAYIIEQNVFSAEKLRHLLASLDRGKLLSMAQAAKKMAIMDSVTRVAEVVKQCALSIDKR